MAVPTKRRKKPQVFLSAEIEALRRLIQEIQEGKLKSGDLHTFLYVCTYAWGKDGVCMRTIPDIARDFRLSRISIQKSTKRLEKAGYLGYLYRVKRPDETIVTVRDFKQMEKLGYQGGTILRSFFKITKPGFSTQTKGRYKKP